MRPGSWSRRRCSGRSTSEKVGCGRHGSRRHPGCGRLLPDVGGGQGRARRRGRLPGRRQRWRPDRRPRRQVPERAGDLQRLRRRGWLSGSRTRGRDRHVDRDPRAHLLRRRTATRCSRGRGRSSTRSRRRSRATRRSRRSRSAATRSADEGDAWGLSAHRASAIRDALIAKGVDPVRSWSCRTVRPSRCRRRAANEEPPRRVPDRRAARGGRDVDRRPSVDVASAQRSVRTPRASRPTSPARCATSSAIR